MKIAKWEQMALYQTENPKKIQDLSLYNAQNYLDNVDLIKLIYVDPDVRQPFNENVDVYSFGLLLVEIFSGKLPYSVEVKNGTICYIELLTKKSHRNVTLLASNNLQNLPKKIVAMSDSCISKECQRPTFQKIHSDHPSIHSIPWYHRHCDE